MRLDLIMERKFPNNHRTWFHGTPTLQSLYQILDNGLQPAQKRANYQEGDKLRSRNRVYLGSLKLALLYGKYVVEVLVNRNDRRLTRDEDELAFDSPYEQGKQAWSDYFADNPEITDKFKFVRAAERYAVHGYQDKIAPLAAKIPHQKHKLLGDPKSAGISSNIASAYPITTKGRTRIIAAYRFEHIPNQFHGRASMYRCAQIIYGSGTIQLDETIWAAESKIDGD